MIAVERDKSSRLSTWHVSTVAHDTCLLLPRQWGCPHFGSRPSPQKKSKREKKRERLCTAGVTHTRPLVVGESMGEEEKKPEEEKKAAVAAAEGEKKAAAAAAETKEEEKKEKKDEGKENKDGKGDGGAGEKKEGEEAPPPPPPPPEEVVMKVYMHCEGCARKVRRSLRGFEGVEAVTADYRLHRIVVKGRKAAEDPMKVVERVQRKSHRRVELISPIPPPKPEKKEEEKVEKPKVEEKKEEPQVIVVLLQVHMHCEACAQEVEKRILRMKGVQAAEPDLKNSTVKVTGVFDPARLVAYVHKRTGKHAVVVKQEPVEKKPEEKAAEAEAKEEKKSNAGEEKEKKEGGDGEKKEDEKKAAEGGDGEGKKSAPAAADDGVENDTEKEKDGGAVTEATVVAVVAAAAAADGGAVKMRRNEFYYYYPRYPVDYAYPPQIFSDENPNACAVM